MQLAGFVIRLLCFECDDAEAQVVAWLDTISGVDALIEQARIAEREACDMLQWAADQTRARSAT